MWITIESHLVIIFIRHCSLGAWHTRSYWTAMHTFETTIFQISHFMPPYRLNGDLRGHNTRKSHTANDLARLGIQTSIAWPNEGNWIYQQKHFFKTNLSIKLVLRLHGLNVARGLGKESESIFSPSQPATKHHQYFSLEYCNSAIWESFCANSSSRAETCWANLQTIDNHATCWWVVQQHIFNNFKLKLWIEYDSVLQQFSNTDSLRYHSCCCALDAGVFGCNVFVIAVRIKTRFPATTPQFQTSDSRRCISSSLEVRFCRLGNNSYINS